MIWAFVIVAVIVAAAVYLPMRAAAARDRRNLAESFETQKKSDADGTAKDELAKVEAQAARDRERPASTVVGDVMRRGRP